MTLSLTGPQTSQARRWWRPTPAHRPADVSPEFHRAFVRGIMETERLRMKTLIGMAVAMVVLITIVATLFPSFVDSIWNTTYSLRYAYIIFIPFIIVESIGLAMLSFEIKRRHDLPVMRRYVNAFIETSMPTFALALQMTHMGDERALNFVIPLLYFFFIILSTLRLDFWLSAFTGFVAGAEFLLMAMFFPAWHGSSYDPWPDFPFYIARSVLLLGGGILAGAVGAQLRRQFVASIAAATARDRVTNLFGQHVSPPGGRAAVERGCERCHRRTRGRGDVRRHPQFHDGGAPAHAGGGGAAARQRLRGAGRDHRPQRRHCEQVSG